MGATSLYPPAGRCPLNLAGSRQAGAVALATNALIDAAQMLALLLGMRNLQQQTDEPGFQQACELHGQWHLRDISKNLQLYLDSKDVPRAVAQRFRATVETLTARPLFDRFANALNGHLTPLLESFVLALKHMHINLPIVLNLGDPSCRSRYASGLPVQCSQVTDFAKQAGLDKVRVQAMLLLDLHVLLKDTVALLESVCEKKTPDERKLTDGLVSQTCNIQVRLLAISSAPERPDLVRMSGDGADICSALCGIADAEALCAEAVRHVGAALQEAAAIWLGDVRQFSDVIDSWSPDQSEADEALFEETEVASDRRARLLCNPRYKDVAPAVEILNKQLALLTSININGHPVLVDSAFIDSCKTSANRAADMVLTTYSVFLICEKLPKISSQECVHSYAR